MDINKDLINIWRLIQYQPGYLIQYYSQMWEKFLEGGKIFYLPNGLFKRSFLMKTSLSSFNRLKKEKINVQEMLYLNY